MSEIKLSFGVSAPHRAHTVATAYGVPTQPTEDGLGQGWVYIFTNQDLLDVTNAQQLELVETIVERFNSYTAVRGQMTDRASERDAAAKEIAKLREALTPSADTKAAYIGEFSFGVTLRAGNEEAHRSVEVPWTTVKEIMAAILAHADESLP